MMEAYERLLLPENLNYAWLKARRLYQAADGYVDHGEISDFELDLEQRLERIHRQFKRRHYKLTKLRPLPRPKKIQDEKPVDRQYFHVSIDDQVAWIAVVNALGPELDKRMPPWSYGNRLYRPAWYEEDESHRSKLEIGPYRHAGGHLYRKFQHSWPLFRRHVALTARAMARDRPPDLSELDQADKLAVAVADREELPYLKAHFWHKDDGGPVGTDLYHASIDLKQFYPSIHAAAVMKGIAVGSAMDDGDPMHDLLSDMLRFRLDGSSIPSETIELVEPQFERGLIQGIPTGLFVAGFLANAAMLPVDIAVNKRLHRQRTVAHFRFVDDHTLLAYNFDALCNWIDWYCDLLQNLQTGAEVNTEKYDPATLGAWLRERANPTTAVAGRAKVSEMRRVALKANAVRDSKLNGATPTKLLTKTLGQVSAIAATNVDILDDEDLRERLKLLEWLLLADIPEREIRPDTRAAFAAGQIAALAPALVHEADGLIDAVRSLELLRSQAPRVGRAPEETIRAHARKIAELEAQVEKLSVGHRSEEERHLKHCFSLLLQAFREYPGKARLFYKLHDYCRSTGHAGLSEIGEWLGEARKRGHRVWADYYAGLSMQILGRSVLTAARVFSSSDALRSEKDASIRHLGDVSRINVQRFSVTSEAWFHSIARCEFSVGLHSAERILRRTGGYNRLCRKLLNLAQRYEKPEPSGELAHLTPEVIWPSGVWAHWVENMLSVDGMPSIVWREWEARFSRSRVADRRAMRRYPELLSERAWTSILRDSKPIPESDVGWLCEVIAIDTKRREAARASKRRAFQRAARSLDARENGWMTLEEWSQFLISGCSPFDPRRSEWTALEIVRQIVAPIESISVGVERLDRLHPSNVLIFDIWKSEFPTDRTHAGVSWETWRTFAQRPGRVKVRETKNAVLDYRYFAYADGSQILDKWERRLVAVGRLMLGLLSFDYRAPRLWNMRGNEQVVPLPRARTFQSLAVSSATLLLLEGCLSGRSAETRAIAREPTLFGWLEGVAPNDAGFDPPRLMGPSALLDAIVKSQAILKRNQLAVVMNQPRQLIPFRLRDFAAGPGAEDDEVGDNE